MSGRTLWRKRWGKFFRLYPGNEVRLKGAPTWSNAPAASKTRPGGSSKSCAPMIPTPGAATPPTAGRSRAPSIGWMQKTASTQRSACTAISSTTPDPDAAGKDFLACLNPHSLEIRQGCKVEASLASAQPASRFQFMRQGYFCADSKDSQPDHLVFNRAVSLKDSYKPGEVRLQPPSRQAWSGDSKATNNKSSGLPPKSGRLCI